MTFFNWFIPGFFFVRQQSFIYFIITFCLTLSNPVCKLNLFISISLSLYHSFSLPSFHVRPSLCRVGDPAFFSQRLYGSMCVDSSYTCPLQYCRFQYSVECHCSRQFEPGNVMAVIDSRCDKPCTGNSSQTCGGTWHISVYKTGKQLPTIPHWHMSENEFEKDTHYFKGLIVRL